MHLDYLIEPDMEISILSSNDALSFLGATTTFGGQIRQAQTRKMNYNSSELGKETIAKRVERTIHANGIR